MCGITGWVNFGRDLTTARQTVRAMTDTMACRGPDEEGVLIDGHAALGHRRLAVIDVEGGKQPMSVQAGATVAITYSGEVYNFTELRAELAGRGHEFRTRSDTEVVLHAYLEWGTAFVDRLNGMYAFAIWDGRGQELILVRDRLGVKPLFYADTAEGLLFGSEPKAILASGLLAPVIDADGFREVFAWIKTPGAAIYQGMREVRPGHFLRVRPEGITEHRYWALEAHEHTDDLPTTIARVRELMEDIVTRQVVSDVPLCSLLSGGIDSSATTALANRTLLAAGRGPVRSFSVDYDGLAETFRADAFRSTPDLPFAHEVAAFAGTDHTDVVLKVAELMDPAVRAATIVARDAPNSVDIDNAMYLLFKAIRQHSTVVLSGEAADEVFGGYSWFHDEQVVEAKTFPWLVSATQVEGTGFLHPDLEATLDLATFKADSYADAIAAVPTLAGEDGLERRMREISHLHLTRFLQILLDRKDRMSMAVGLEVRVPYCDHRLVEYVFNTPWAMKTFDGREKSLLRAAVADLLPESVLQRVKSPFPVPQDPAYHVALQQAVGALVAEEDAPILRVINQYALQGMLQAPPEAGPMVRDGLESALAGHEWASRYGVAIDV